MTALKFIFLAIFLFFTPIHSLFILVFFAVILDTIFGLVTSKIMKAPILSRKFFRFAVKFLVYFSCLMLGFGADHLIINDVSMIFTTIPYAFSKILTIVFLSIEAFSIDEKVRNANKGKGMKYYFVRLIKAAKYVKVEYDEIGVELRDKKKEEEE